MAQHKMHCDVQRTHCDNQKAIVGGKCYSLKKSLQQDDLRASSKDFEISTLNSRNSDKRCAVLTLLPESGGRWRIVAQAPEYLNRSNQLGSGAQVNMDGLHIVSPSPINAFNGDQRKAWKGLHDVTYPIKSFSPRSFPGPDVKHQSRSRTLNSKVSKFNGISINPSSQSSISCRNSPGLIPQRSNSCKSSDIFVENSKAEKCVRRNLRKKARKKGKQNKKLPNDAVSAEPEVFSEDYGHGSLASKACGNHNMDQGGGLLPYATSQADSLSDGRVNIIVLEGNNSGILNSSESPKTCTSYIDEVDLSEAKVPSTVKNLTWGRPIINPEIRLPIEDLGFPIVDGGVVETHALHISCYEGKHSNGFSDIHSRVLDSVSVSSNSDNSTVTSCDAKLGDKESNEISQSEPADFDHRKGYLSYLNSLSSVVDFYEFTEGARHGYPAFSSSDVQVVAPGKKGKQAKMVPRSSSANKLGSGVNLHGRTGKENNNRVWQKVQKNIGKESNSEFKKVHPVGAQTLKEASLVRRNSSVSEVDMSSKAEDRKRLKDKASRKLKRKTSPGSKQEYKSYPHRASYPSKVISNDHEKIAVHQNDILNILTQVSENKRLSSVPRSHSQFGCPELGFQTGAVESVNFKLFKNSQDCHENLDLRGSIYNTVSGMKEQNQDSSLAKSCSSLDKLNLLPVQYLPHLLINEVAQTEMDISLAEHSKQNHSSGSHLQKWMPIGNKDPRTTNSTRCGSLSTGNSDGQCAAEDWTLRNSIDEKAVTNSQNPISLLDIGMMSPPLSSESSSSQEDENYALKLKNTIAHTFKEENSKHVIADCLISESKDQNSSAVKIDLKNIVQAVNHACRMQLASEAVQIATGGPIAEFERLLHFSSPVICRLPNPTNCEICSQNQVSGVSLCRHETPNISLGRLWQWYEELGSYGLEIRAEDYEHSNRLGVDRFSFRAYFVPFLSAVQLFRDSKSHSTNNSNVVPSSGVLETRETGETFQSSPNIGHLPIFSVLVPQPRTSDASSFPPEKEVSESELSSASDEEKIPSAGMRGSNDVELLFEYFESEQPWQRQPLYEKIQELIRGDGPSQCKMYGDPANLNSINLQDLHPASWYSVAWYPIYRIPDGNFRAAFLTYHSLGHMIHRSAKVDSAETCIVSPVVGLQSYNAQSECWFQLKHSAQSQTTETSGLNPSGILKERLKSLEETASIMSRAVVSKGNQTSVNRQPDYEFFVSRQRSS